MHLLRSTALAAVLSTIVTIMTTGAYAAPSGSNNPGPASPEQPPNGAKKPEAVWEEWKDDQGAVRQEHVNDRWEECVNRRRQQNKDLNMNFLKETCKRIQWWAYNLNPEEEWMAGYEARYAAEQAQIRRQSVKQQQPEEQNQAKLSVNDINGMMLQMGNFAKKEIHKGVNGFVAPRPAFPSFASFARGMRLPGGVRAPVVI